MRTQRRRLRTHILVAFDTNHITVPVDLFHLCRRFFAIDISSLYSAIQKKIQVSDPSEWRRFDRFSLSKLAVAVSERAGCYMAHTIYSVLISQVADNNDCILAALHYGREFALKNWELVDAAERDIELATKLAPKNATFKYALSGLLFRQKRYKEALEHALAAIELKNSAVYHYAATKCLKKLERFQEAKEHFEAATELKPNNAKVCYEYAKLLRDALGDYAASKVHYARCLAIDARKHGANGSYGYLLYLMREYAEARRYLEIELKVAGRGRVNKWAHYYLLLVCRAMGEEEERLEARMCEAVRHIETPEVMLLHLEKMMRADPDSMDLHRRFERAIKAKIVAKA